MHRWRMYLFEQHSEATLRAWARRLHLFRFVRAFGGHANDGDELLVIYRYESLEELESLFAHVGLAPVRFSEKPDQPVPGVAYPYDEYGRFPSLIPGTEWIAQPGHCTIGGSKAFVWCEAGRIRIAVVTGYEVTDDDVATAEAIEGVLSDLPLARIEPPVDSERCISPRYYPEYFLDADALGAGHPSLDQVRAWGYDESATFAEQDEDLILSDVYYMPVLAELAADPTCPKQEDAASIISLHSQFLLLHRHREKADRMAELARSVRVEEGTPLARWRAWYLWLHERMIHPTPFSPSDSERAAWLLAVGEFCMRTFSATGRTVDGYTEYLASTGSFKLYVYVAESTGLWTHQQNVPLDGLNG